MHKYTLPIKVDKDGFSLDKANISNQARKLAEEYACASPFPNIVIDNFLPLSVAEDITKSFPKTPLPNDVHFMDGGFFEHKKRQILPYDCDRYAKEFFNFFNSAQFLEFLEELTGIKGLISDPYFEGGGFHETTNGGKLGVHTDFRLQRRLNLERRVNLIIYLNKDWKKEYNGYLELWDKEMKLCKQFISPDFNRCVVFNTNSESFHGHPDQLTVPYEVSRRSIALYYYTASEEVHRNVKDVSTIFKARPEDSQELKAAAIEQNNRSLGIN